MKRASARRAVAVILALLLLCGCSAAPRGDDPPAEPGEYRVGVWISYSEMNALLAGGGFRTRFAQVVENCRTLGVTDLFVHVRAFCDSICPSDYFPLTEAAAAYDFDLLEHIIDRAHAAGMRVHAWINPYRVRTVDGQVDALPEDSPVRRWLAAGETGNYCVAGGVYLNPAAAAARRLVIGGVRELCERYDLDGIHFDDYFYPTDDPAFDADSYAAYTAAAANPLPLGDWRRANVNMLISGCYTAVKFVDRDLIFSVSPAASIENDREQLYADVAAWVQSDCVDWVIPQLYFSFTYPQEEYCFERLLKEWRALAAGGDAELLIGLAAYKVGDDTLPDAAAWCGDATLLAREAALCQKDAAVRGHVYFSYSSLFGDGEAQTRARRELLAKE